MKMLFAIAALVGVFTTPVMAAEEVQNTETPIVEEVETKEVYTFVDGEYSSVITILDEEKLEMEVTKGDTVISAVCKYTLKENVLTVLLDGEEFNFNILENNVLEPVKDEPVIEEEPPVEIDPEIKEDSQEFLELLEALRTELKKENKDMELIAKILLGIAGAVSSVLLAVMIRLIKLKITNINKDEIYKKAEEKANAKFAEYQEDVKTQLKNLEILVCKKIDETEEQRQKEAEAQSLKLKESVELAKKNLDIKRVLNEE